MILGRERVEKGKKGCILQRKMKKTINNKLLPSLNSFPR
jgi:stalled ribosome alternative rescue factor ArfA